VTRRGLAAAGLAAAALALAVPAGAAAASTSAPATEVGAKTVDITPPPAGAADPGAFAACKSALRGPRPFAFDEPYADVNGNGRRDDDEPSCDANLNGRYDRIYDSGAEIGSPRPARGVHDPLSATAVAIAERGRVAVIVSVTAQGLFNTYIDRMIARAKALDPAITDMVVSADHNESSPDTVGIYGGPAPEGSPAGLTSGIDDYYMSFLVERVAQAAAGAARSLQPGSLWARRFGLPQTLKVNLSDNWPTTDNSESRPAAIDPTVGVLQGRNTHGKPVFTVMSLAAHNQEIGHSGSPELSEDWPGYFVAALHARLGGTAMFLVADNGSEEDPQTQPPLSPKGADAGTFAQAKATGQAFASAVAKHAPEAQRLRAGPLRLAQRSLCVPIENNLFKAAAAIGLFGQRQTYVHTGATCTASGAAVPGGTGPTLTGVPDSLQTGVGLLDVGPDLQLILNPGEAFPALVLGSPWGLEDVPAGCRGRANPPVPSWLSHATFRLQVGLANDFIGYEIPPWAYIGSIGSFTVGDPACASGTVADPTSSTDSAGHHHKLETEGVGPTAAAAVANGLTDLQRADAPDRSAHVVRGRFVLANGSLSRSAIGAHGVALASGALLGDPETRAFGRRSVAAGALFMDYEGQPQRKPGITTRGMLVLDRRGCVTARYYLDVFPPAAAGKPLGARRLRSRRLPRLGCPASRSAGVAPIQRAAAAAAGLRR
jgi:hypothetical protein